MNSEMKQLSYIRRPNIFLTRFWIMPKFLQKIIGAQNVILMNEMVRANVGIAFSSFSINKFKNCIPYDSSLIQVPFRENIVGEIGYLLPKGKILEPKLKTFLNLIEKELTDI